MSKKTISEIHHNIKYDYAKKIVEREIFHCCSYMMSQLPHELIENEDLFHMFQTSEYETEVEYQCSDCDNSIFETIEGNYDLHEVEKSSISRYCDQCNSGKVFTAFDVSLNEYHSEIFEHWIITNWLSRKLQEHDEETCNLFDFTIWGRSCTGQAIALDHVIQSIAWDLWSEEMIKEQLELEKR